MTTGAPYTDSKGRIIRYAFNYNTSTIQGENGKVDVLQVFGTSIYNLMLGQIPQPFVPSASSIRLKKEQGTGNYSLGIGTNVDVALKNIEETDRIILSEGEFSIKDILEFGANAPYCVRARDEGKTPASCK